MPETTRSKPVRANAISKSRVKFTNLQKILYPSAGVTKYARVRASRFCRARFKDSDTRYPLSSRRETGRHI